MSIDTRSTIMNDDVVISTGPILRFLTLGSTSISLLPDDDSISEAISPPGGFRAFGTNYSDLYVCTIT